MLNPHQHLLESLVRGGPTAAVDRDLAGRLALAACVVDPVVGDVKYHPAVLDRFRLDGVDLATDRATVLK